MAVKGYAGIQENALTPVEYLESTGTQYINNVFTTNHYIGYKVVMEVCFTKTTSGRQLLGNTSRGYWFGINADGYYEIGDTSVSDVKYSEDAFDTVELSLTADGYIATLTVNGEVCTTRYVEETIRRELSLFAAYSSSAADYFCNCKIKDVKYYDVLNHLGYDVAHLQKHLKPYVDKDGVGCMYDLRNGDIYYNDGTGSFVVGAETGDDIIEFGVAKKIEKTYIGINGVAEKVKKVYVGVDGVAELCWRSDPNFKYGTDVSASGSNKTSLTIDTPFKPIGFMLFKNSDNYKSSGTILLVSSLGSCICLPDSSGTPKTYTGHTVSYGENSVTVKTNSESYFFRGNYYYVVWGTAEPKNNKYKIGTLERTNSYKAQMSGLPFVPTGFAYILTSGIPYENDRYDIFAGTNVNSYGWADASDSGGGRDTVNIKENESTTLGKTTNIVIPGEGDWYDNVFGYGNTFKYVAWLEED